MTRRRDCFWIAAVFGASRRIAANLFRCCRSRLSDGARDRPRLAGLANGVGDIGLRVDALESILDRSRSGVGRLERRGETIERRGCCSATADVVTVTGAIVGAQSALDVAERALGMSAKLVVDLELGAAGVEIDGALERRDLAWLCLTTAAQRLAQRGRELAQLGGCGTSRFRILESLLDFRIDGPCGRPRALDWSCACHLIDLPRTNRGSLAEGDPRLNLPKCMSVWMRGFARSHTNSDAAVRQA